MRRSAAVAVASGFSSVEKVFRNESSSPAPANPSTQITMDSSARQSECTPFHSVPNAERPRLSPAVIAACAI